MIYYDNPMPTYHRAAGRFAARTFFAQHGGKLERLKTHLKTVSPLSREVTLSLAQVERILGGPLPPFAKSQPSWWANRPQADAWLDAGFEVEFVHLTVQQPVVRFKRLHLRSGAALVSGRTTR